MEAEMTRYQRLIIKYLEAQYQMPTKKVIQFLHKRNRFSDIAETIGCSPKTLLSICKELGIDDPPTRIGYTAHYKNATDFLRQFANVEDAIVECRDPNRLALSVEDTQEKLGIGRSTVVRHTPEYLKFTFNFSKDRKRGHAPNTDHPWKQ